MTAPLVSGRTARALSAGLAASVCVAAGAAATTLGDAVAFALEHNPALLSERETLRVANESYVQARSAFGPRISLSVDGTSQRASIDEAATLFTPQGTLRANAQTSSQTLSVSETLYAGGGGAAAIDAARADVSAARAHLRGAEIQTIAQVASVYVGVLRDDALYAIAERAVERLAREDQEAAARFKAHEVTVTDLAQANARLRAAQSAAAHALAQAQTTRAQYVQSVGQAPEGLTPPPPLADLPANVDEAFDEAERLSPALQESRFAELSSRIRVALERDAGHLSVNANLAASNAPLETYDAQQYGRTLTATITVTKPLYTSGLISSRVHQALDRNNHDRLQTQAVRDQVIQSVSQAWSERLAADAALTLDTQQMACQQSAYDSIRKELKAGLRSTIEVLNAEQELEAAQLAVARSTSDGYLARVSVLAQIGRLDAKAFDAAVRPYDAERELQKRAHRQVAPWADVFVALDRVGARRLSPAPLAVRPNGPLSSPPGSVPPSAFPSDALAHC